VGFGSTIPVEADNGLSNLTRGDVEKLRKLGGVSPTSALISGLPLITMNRQVSANEAKHARHMRKSQQMSNTKSLYSRPNGQARPKSK
jgi:hypothetical protein